MSTWIRWGGLLSFLALLAVVGGFWLLFIDGIVERLIEDVGTRLVGAKVELDAADLMFLPAGLTLTRLQVTSPEEPMTNAVEVARVAVSLDGLNLFRRKVIVEELTADGVRLGTPRATSGAIDQREERERTDEADGRGPIFTMPRFEIPDVDQVLAQERLESLTLISGLKADVEEARKRWEARIENLPGKETFDDYRARIDRLKDATRGGVAGALGGISEAASLKQALERDLAAIKDAKDDLEETLGSLEARLARVKRAPQADLRRLQEKYSLSPEGLANLSETLLGQVIGDRVRRGTAWYVRLMPLVERATEAAARSGPEVVRPLRASGVDVRFTETDPLPDFLIRRAGVSLHLDVGEVGGTIENVTPDQDVLGKPTTFVFSGENLKGLRSVSLRGVMNHIDPAKPRDRVNGRMTGYRIDTLELSKQASWPVTVVEGRADLKVQAGIDGETLTAHIRSDVNALEIRAGKDTESNRLTKALSSAIRGVSSVDVEVDVVGTVQDYEVRIQSGLDKVLQQAAGRLVKDLSADFRRKLSVAISEQVDGPLKDLRQRLSDVQDLQRLLSGRVSRGNDLLGSLLKAGAGQKGLPETLPKELPGGFRLPF